MSTALTPATSALPLRQDDPISLVFIIKVMLITAILLAVVYVVLRWFASRSGPGGRTAAKTDLQCTTALRLSSRTRVYLIESGASRVLVTESSNGATVTVLAEGAPVPALEDAP